MINTKKTINIAFAVNDGYMKHLNVAIFSLLKNNSNASFCINILCDQLSEQSKESVKTFLKFHKDTTIEFIELKDRISLFEKLELSIDYISKETYFRYILADVLPDKDKVLYLDADILVVGDISKLYNTDISKYYMAGAEDPHILADGYKPTVGFGHKDLYVNAGVLLFNLTKIRQDNMVQKLFSNTLKYWNRIKYQDQDILNITFRGHIRKIDKRYNFVWYNVQNNISSYSDAAIFHYIGGNKPWDSYGLDTRPDYFYVYDEYCDDYLRVVRGVKDDRQVKYGVFTYDTENVGDDIQSVAARRFLPRIDYLINRDDIDSVNYKDAKSVKLIMNGWFSHEPILWPYINKKVDPLLISMHISSAYEGRVKRAFSTQASRDFLKQHEPVGARNLSTQSFLKSIGIKSFFSGCMTLTIQKSPRIKKQEYILAVDIPEDVLEAMRKQTKRRIITAPVEVMTRSMSPSTRIKIAEFYLSLFQSAHCVVTTRLHATLPSIALETPVLFIMKKSQREKDRLAGLLELMNVIEEQEYINNPKKYNIDKPPKNKDTYKPLREELIKKCKNYTGVISNQGFLPDDSTPPIDDCDTIQLYLDTLGMAFKYQHITDIFTGKTTYYNDDLEKQALYLRNMEQEYSTIIEAQQSIKKTIKNLGKLTVKKVRRKNER
ncbi:polysaccharide pyruvyl transferase family protein [Christensenellaceae bacterium OttesenSCG-928-L17]|nr:polysaccharide pyruvyl transferase family protein [Christensenellaceae bacterium OttesenSCG-928-L17]